MVPMKMSYQCNCIDRFIFSNKLLTEITKPSPEVEKKWALAISLYRNARGVAAVFLLWTQGLEAAEDSAATLAFA